MADVAEEFFEATIKRAHESSTFLHVMAEAEHPTPEQLKLMEAGMALGITAAVDELNTRGWLKAH